MTTENFYQELSHFSSFLGITESHNFFSVPRDWVVIITDVKGSTVAIEQGRYKDVNTVGAAAIVAAKKGMDGIEFPFVFGGDGATMLIPPTKVDSVVKELMGLKRLSEKTFELGLRVGLVNVSELLDEGAIIDVAKFELNAGQCIAIFSGGGLNLAESKIKGQEEKYAAKDDGDGYADLGGLSCRWNPIPSKHGLVISLIVDARTENPNEAYRNILQKLNEIFEGDLEIANPVNISKASYKSIGECYQNEKRFHKSIFSISFLFRFFEIIAAVLIFKFKIPPLFFNPKRYANSMRTHSDFRKFDDLLRMIIDCTKEQSEQIISYLDEQYRAGTLCYGVHQSENSLMTCYVDDLNDGNHIHFIDGGNGGYAMAAKQLKEQIKLLQKKKAS